MKTERRDDDRILVLTPDDDLDAATLPDYARKLRPHLDAGVESVVIDFAAVRLLPSTAVGFLIQTRRRLSEKDGKLVLANASSTVKRTLAMLGVDIFFPIYSNIDDALAALSS